MEGWMDAATLARTLNLQGRFLAYPAEGLPFLLREGLQVALVPPVTDCPRCVTVVSVEAAHGKHEGGFHVTFSQVEEPVVAEALVGCHCLVRESEVEASLLEANTDEQSATGLARFLASQPANADGVLDLEGRPWRVVDRVAGPLGVLVRVDELPGQALLVVAREEGDDLLIPFVKEMVRDIDESSRVVSVNVPQGLLDL